jgi:hypothetical protein
MVRGQFLGHWLSAAARLGTLLDDREVLGKADYVVGELARCQRENGGEWVGSLPEKYLDWIARGKYAWAPHYVMHKTLMGLLDAYRYAGNARALEILCAQARWFTRWTAQFSRTQMDDILEHETGGMLEAWADLYAITGDPEHLELMPRYDRARFFDRLRAGEDLLTNRHANTTIPEAHGAARAWEVTGETRWREIAEAYWRCAVTERGHFCTGGQTSGEGWTPPFQFAARLGEKNQEHCTVYNMMRLADYLLRWTGDAAYADYWERNLYNGILAQQHRWYGMVAYFLPLEPGAQKKWGTPTEDFWCCHGSLVQAHTRTGDGIYFQSGDGLAICQYLPSEATWTRDGQAITIRQTDDPRACDIQHTLKTAGAAHRPMEQVTEIAIAAETPADFALRLRVPAWAAGAVTLTVNGAPQPVAVRDGYLTLARTWGRDTVRLTVPKALTTCPLPDEPGTVAFLEGPVVLAGLCDDGRTLYGDIEHPDTLLAPDNEREWNDWKLRYRTVNQDRTLRFVPLHEVIDERYTVYFPVREKA